jgi:hypothetical protein
MVTSYPCGITKDMGIFSGSLLIKMENWWYCKNIWFAVISSLWNRQEIGKSLFWEYPLNNRKMLLAPKGARSISLPPPPQPTIMTSREKFLCYKHLWRNVLQTYFVPSYRADFSSRLHPQCMCMFDPKVLFKTIALV